MPPRVHALDHLVLTITDLNRTIAFFRDALGMMAHQFHAADGSQRSALSFGQQKINLHVAGHEFEPKAARPGPGTADLCFLTDTPLEDWQAHLADMGIETELGPVPRTGATGPILSLYLRDPDGNLIEIGTAAP